MFDQRQAFSTCCLPWGAGGGEAPPVADGCIEKVEGGLDYILALASTRFMPFTLTVCLRNLCQGLNILYQSWLSQGGVLIGVARIMDFLFETNAG